MDPELQRLTNEIQRLTRATDPDTRAPAANEAHTAMLAARDEAARLARAAEHTARQHAAELDRRIAELEHRKQAMLADLEPALEQVRALNRVVDAIGLYLGLREQFVTIRADGQPAPAGTPLTIYQTVLAMDEESKLAAWHGGLTYRDVNDFDAWLTDHPGHLEQVLPDQLGIVAIVPRRAEMHTGDPFADADLRRRNSRMWVLVRNGDRLHRFSADDLTIGELLIPDPARWERLFADSDGRPLRPGTPEWERARAEATDAQRHAMRIGLVLQGVVDRTDLLSPSIPQGSLDLLTAAGFHDPRVRLVLDSERAIDDGRPTWREYQSARNARLRVGHRIVGDFTSYSSRQWTSGQQRTHPKHAQAPKSGTPHTITGTDRLHGEPAFRFSYDRADSVWVEREQRLRAPRTRASYLFAPSDRHVLAVDETSEADLEYYATSRRHARDYLDAIPLIRAALDVKRAEREAQAPFVAEAARRAAAATNLAPDAAAPLVEAEIAVWRAVTQHHRPLLDTSEPRAAEAMRAVVQAVIDRVEHADEDAETVARVLADADGDVIAVLRRPNGRVDAISPEPSPLTPDVIPPLTFARVRRYTAKRLDSAGEDRWRHLPRAASRAGRVLWAAPAWADWNHLATRTADPSACTEPELVDAARQLAGLAAVHAYGTVCRVVAARAPGRTMLFAVVDTGFGKATVGSILEAGGALTAPAVDSQTGYGQPMYARTSDAGRSPVDRLPVLWVDADAQARLDAGDASATARAARQRDLDQRWWDLCRPLRDAVREHVTGLARDELAVRYSADERLWPRGWRDDADEAARADLAALDQLLDGWRRDADLEGAESLRDLLTPGQIEALPDAARRVLEGDGPSRA